MHRRGLIAIIAGIAALPLAAHAQQNASSTAQAASADISTCVPNSAGFPQRLDGPRWTEILPSGRKRRPCRDDGDGKFDRFFASVRKADRDFNIEPPASPYAIMRRAYPYRGENSGPGKDDRWRA